jgi:hypothetical protein
MPHQGVKDAGLELNPLCPAYRPSVHSAQQIGMPNNSSEMKYAIMNAPLPYCAANPGNRRKLPSPTALPATAMITPKRDVHVSPIRPRCIRSGCRGRVEPGRVENHNSNISIPRRIIPQKIAATIFFGSSRGGVA